MNGKDPFYQQFALADLEDTYNDNIFFAKSIYCKSRY